MNEHVILRLRDDVLSYTYPRDEEHDLHASQAKYIISRLTSIINKTSDELFGKDFSNFNNAFEFYTRPFYGISKEYYESGRLKAEIPYKCDKITGLVKEDYEKDPLKKEAHYQDNLLEGVGKVFTENGKLAKEIPYVNGLKQGIENLYNENDRIFATITHENDCAVCGKRHY